MLSRHYSNAYVTSSWTGTSSADSNRWGLIYIVDFACFEKRLVIELDGGQHAEKPLIDAKRTAWLTSQGFRVVRFWNNEVLNSIESILAVIQEKLTHA